MFLCFSMGFEAFPHVPNVFSMVFLVFPHFPMIFSMVFLKSMISLGFSQGSQGFSRVFLPIVFTSKGQAGRAAMQSGSASRGCGRSSWDMGKPWNKNHGFNPFDTWGIPKMNDIYIYIEYVLLYIYIELHVYIYNIMENPLDDNGITIWTITWDNHMGKNGRIIWRT